MEHAHELPEFFHFLEEIDILRGFVFGFTHTLIPLIGFYFGWSINRLLKIISNGYVAGFAGIIIPITLTKFKIDPALASGVILTTVTDVFGFLSFLGLATIFLI